MKADKFARVMTPEETQVFEDMRERIIKVLMDETYYPSLDRPSMMAVRMETLTRLVTEAWLLSQETESNEELVAEFGFAIRDAVFGVKLK
jgi:hypothetical protein